jgi:hypothetical protein
MALTARVTADGHANQFLTTHCIAARPEPAVSVSDFNSSHWQHVSESTGIKVRCEVRAPQDLRAPCVAGPRSPLPRALLPRHPLAQLAAYEGELRPQQTVACDGFGWDDRPEASQADRYLPHLRRFIQAPRNCGARLRTRRVVGAWPHAELLRSASVPPATRATRARTAHARCPPGVALPDLRRPTATSLAADWINAAKSKSLLNMASGVGGLPFRLTGTADAAICTRASISAGIPHTGLCVVFELKKSVTDGCVRGA